jgi:D-alanyl-D-alanine carboxypeptidase
MLSRWIGGGLARTTTMVAAGIVAFSATMAFHPETADAKRRVHHVSSSNKPLKHGRTHRVRAAARSHAFSSDMVNNPLYSAIVVDVKTGRTLYEASPDGLRHPASITKVMTLYLLFEQLQAGRISLSTPLPVSAHAAAQSPTKLGLRAGDTIRVDDAIKGVVTRSANDAAVVIAEALGGSESNFCVIMTRKAHALGMTRTRYVNASGLPDQEQITTAHDLAILGMAIQKRFPKYYRFFSTRSFVYRGHGIASHNHLLGSVEGVDGIKTGYTRSSGFNLLTSVRRDNRQLIAVVMGGRSAPSRDVVMRHLIDDYLPRAYTGNATETSAPAVAQADDDSGASSVAMAPRRLPAVRPAVIAEAPKPRVAAPVALVAVRPPQANVAPAPEPRPQITPARPAIASTAQAGPVLRWMQGPAPVMTAPATPPVQAERDTEAAPAATATVQMVRTATYRVDEDTRSINQAGSGDSAPAASQHSGWIIQIGATNSEGAARQLLASAKMAGDVALASASPFTETVNRNGTKLWRARFGGFDDRRQALSACSSLKAASFTCVAVKL